jgi:sugar lactone lactonase YvrE
MTTIVNTELLETTELQFAEGLRWHEGRLWLSDLLAHTVYAVTGDVLEPQVHLPDDQPSGLGFLPGGEPLVVAMRTRQLRRITSQGAELYADLSGASMSECNDMLVDPKGRAYISTFGYDLRGGEEAKPGSVILAAPGREAVEAAGDLMMPNGIVQTPDGRTLIVSELLAGRLIAYDVAEDGVLSGRRTFATLAGASPDGLAIDAEGGVWAATSTSGEVLRVVEGSEITHRIISRPGEWTTSCALGGDDGRTLFVATVKTSFEDWVAGRAVSAIRTAHVDVPAAGL